MHTILPLAALLFAASAPSFFQKPEEAPRIPVTSNDRELLEIEYFATADFNNDRWISYREAVAALRLTRASFAQYDRDTDGRITQAEFNRRFRELLDRTGGFIPPIPEGVTALTPGEPVPPEISGPLEAIAFIAKYDFNVDGNFDSDELQTAAQALGFAGVSSEALMGMLDVNTSGFVEPDELAGVLTTLAEMKSKGKTPNGPRPNTIEELFGGAEPRAIKQGATPRPPYIQGPVRPFRRLDLDDNGFIEISDLVELSVAAHPRIRPAALIATLDSNGDGALSPAELAAAFDG